MTQLLTCSCDGCVKAAENAPLMLWLESRVAERAWRRESWFDVSKTKDEMNGVVICEM